MLFLCAINILRHFRRTGGNMSSKSRAILLGFQHAITMFASVILVPKLLGLDISVAILMAGVETLVFHFVTKNKIPIFLGSSFEFMPALMVASSAYGMDYARGGMVICCFVYLLFALLVYLVGTEKIIALFPPIVSGSISILVGLSLASYAIELASSCWVLAILAFFIAGGINIFGSRQLQSFSIIISLVVSFFAALILSNLGLLDVIDFADTNAAAWFGIPKFVLPKFSLNAALIILPYTLCGIVDHVGDVVVAGIICKKDYTTDPGVHRTLLGDGLAAMISSFFGGPPNATYSENIGLLALTNNYETLPLRIAAVIAIFMGFIPKISALIGAIPSAIIGGISIMLFGSISAMGIRQFSDNKVNFDSPANVIIVAAMLIIGLGGAKVSFSALGQDFMLEGIGLATVVGVLLNAAFKFGKIGLKNVNRRVHDEQYT